MITVDNKKLNKTIQSNLKKNKANKVVAETSKFPVI